MHRLGVIALACAGVAVGLAPAAATAHHAVAVASGYGPAVAHYPAPPSSHWVLRGSRLLIDFGGPLEVRHRRHAVSAVVTCGDDASDQLDGNDVPVWATLVRARVKLTGASTRARLTFSRDIAARVSACQIVTDGRKPDSLDVEAAMTLRRGHRPVGCVVGDDERVIARDADAILTATGPTDGDFDTGAVAVTAYRACLLAQGRLTTILLATDHLDELTKSETSYNSFTLSGSWTAWTTTTISPNGFTEAVDLADLITPLSRLKTRSFSDASYGGAIEDIALSATGSVAWSVAPSPDLHSSAPAWSVFGVPLGAQRILLGGGAGDVSDLAISPDGTTVTWQQDAVAHQAGL